MRLSHDPRKTRACFDDPNLVSRAGLVPVMGLAERAGLLALVREHVTLTDRCGVNAEAKIGCLVRRAPLLPGADVLAFVDIDSTQKRVYGHRKQGAAFGHTKISGKTVLVRGLNALVGTVCTPQAAPVIAGTRLRGGSANTARGAVSLIAGSIGTARAAGCTGILVARMDSGYYSAAVCQAASRAGAHFSVTARLDPRS